MPTSSAFLISNTISSFNLFRGNLISYLCKNSFDVTIAAHFDVEPIPLIETLCHDIINVDTRPTKNIRKIATVIKKNLNISKMKKFDLAVGFGIFSCIYLAMIPASRKDLVLAGLGSGILGSKLNKIIFYFLIIFSNFIVSRVVVLNEADQKLVKRYFFRRVQIHFGEGQSVQLVNNRYTERDFSDVRFSYIGRLVKDKGIIDFIELARKCPKRKFQIFGTFDKNNPTCLSEREFFELISSVHNLEYLGFCDKQHIWSNTECLVMTSVREGLSSVMLEAISNRVDVIGYSVPGVVDVYTQSKLEHKLVEFGDMNSLVSLARNFIQTDFRQRDNMASLLLNELNERSCTYFRSFLP